MTAADRGLGWPDQPDQGTLVLTANAPGNPQPPAGFGDREARQIVFVKD